MLAALLAMSPAFAESGDSDSEPVYITELIGSEQTVSTAPKAYYYLTFGDDATKYVGYYVDKATGAVSFPEKVAGEIKMEDNDHFLWEVLVKENKALTLKNKATEYYLAVNKSGSTADFVSNVIEYTNGSALEKTFGLASDNVLTYGTQEVSLDGSFKLGGNGEKLVLTKVANQKVPATELKNLGDSFTFSFSGNPLGAEAFTGVTVVDIPENNSYESTGTYYFIKGKYDPKDNGLNSNNTFVVLSTKSAITGVAAPNGYTYTTVKGDKLKEYQDIEGKEVKAGEYPRVNAIFTAVKNLNLKGKYSLYQPEVYCVVDGKWATESTKKVWVAATGNAGSALVNANTDEKNAAWMTTTTNSNTTVDLKEFLTERKLVYILTNSGDATGFNQLVYDADGTDDNHNLAANATETEKQKKYLSSQWYISANDGKTLKFINRETGYVMPQSGAASLIKTPSANIYEMVHGGESEYIKLVDVENATPYDGYVVLSDEELVDEHYLNTEANISSFDIDVSLTQEIGLYGGEQKINLVDKTDNPLKWRFSLVTKKVKAADGKIENVADTIYSIIKYKYYNEGELSEAADTLKVFKYNLNATNAVEKVVPNQPKVTFSALGKNFVLENAKTEGFKPTAMVMRKVDGKFMIAPAPQNNELKYIFGKGAANLNASLVSSETSGSSVLIFTKKTVETIPQYEVPKSHFALEMGGAYLGANAHGTGILTNDASMLKSEDVDSAFSFFAFTADTIKTRVPFYYLSTNGRMMYNPSDSINALNEKLATLNPSFDGDEIAALKAEKALFVNGNLDNNEPLVKFQKAEYVKATVIKVAGREIKDEALKPFLFNVEEVDGQAVLKNGDKYVAVVNGVAVLRRAADAAKFDVVAAEAPTSNESVVASEVKVVANNGSVVVKNAAGKNVVVSTILGQVVANEVLTSDNATINVPAGIVVVAVEGESFKINVR